MSASIEDKEPLYKLKAWAAPLLIKGNYPEGIRIQFIEVARNESPTQTFKLVESLAKYYKFSAEEARRVAQHTRYLAVIKRDYPSEFNPFICNA